MKITRSKLFAMMLFGIYSSDISITTVTIIRDGREYSDLKYKKKK